MVQFNINNEWSGRLVELACALKREQIIHFEAPKGTTAQTRQDIKHLTALIGNIASGSLCTDELHHFLTDLEYDQQRKATLLDICNSSFIPDRSAEQAMLQDPEIKPIPREAPSKRYAPEGNTVLNRSAKNAPHRVLSMLINKAIHETSNTFTLPEAKVDGILDILKSRGTLSRS